MGSRLVTRKVFSVIMKKSGENVSQVGVSVDVANVT